MAFKQYRLTLNGGLQRLSTVLADQAVGGADDIPCRDILLQPGTSNANAIFVGDADVTVAIYAFKLPAALNAERPVHLGEGYDAGPLRLSDFFVRGTNAELLHIGLIPF